jgi:hypothetical protein
MMHLVEVTDELAEFIAQEVALFADKECSAGGCYDRK